MIKTRRMRLLALSFVLLGCSGPTSSAGTYITQAPGFVMMLQIEPGSGDKIDGTISSVQVLSNGEISALRKPISGTIDDKAVNFSIIYPPGNDPTSVPVTGIMTDQGLELTFFVHGHSTSATFRKGKAEEFSAIAQSIQNQSNK